MPTYKKPTITKKPSRYDKPGKGVSKTEGLRKGFKAFFSLFYRNITKLVVMNVIYFVVLFPIMCFSMILILSNNQSFIDLTKEINTEEQQTTVATTGETSETGTASGEEEVELNWIERLAQSFPLFTVMFAATAGVVSLNENFVYLLLLIFIASLVFYGPITAGITYCMRNYVRSEYAFISDAFTRAKKNFPQAMVFGFVDMLILFSVLLYNFTPVDSLFGSNEIFSIVMKTASIIVATLYYIMRGYIYLMIVTFKLRFTQIIKNALSFAVIGALRNFSTIIFTLIVVVLTVILGYMSFFLIPLLVLSIVHFILIFNSYPAVDRFMISPAMAEKAALTGTDESPIFTDMTDVKKK